MASIRKLPSGNYRAEVARQGVRSSKVFPTKQAAKDWASREEQLILNSESVKSQTPFGDVMDRYAREVSSTKRGARWEIIRIEKLRKEDLAKKKLDVLALARMVGHRDIRQLQTYYSETAEELAKRLD